MKTKLLIIVATHGNERIGVEVVKKLKQFGLGKYFDVLVGNPQALKRDVRFIDKDLNRSYSGKVCSKYYEERLASRNLKLASQYDLILDLHEASAGRDDFIIVPRENVSAKFPLELINLKRVLLWPSPGGPLSRVLANAIELEFGMKNRKRQLAVNKCAKIVKCFIEQIYRLASQIKLPKKELYYVYGKLMDDGQVVSRPLIDFKLAKINGEQFYPLLVGQYLNLGIACYKMRKINYRPSPKPGLKPARWNNRA